MIAGEARFHPDEVTRIAETIPIDAARLRAAVTDDRFWNTRHPEWHSWREWVGRASGRCTAKMPGPTAASSMCARIFATATPSRPIRAARRHAEKAGAMISHPVASAPSCRTTLRPFGGRAGRSPGATCWTTPSHQSWPASRRVERSASGEGSLVRVVAADCPAYPRPAGLPQRPRRRPPNRGKACGTCSPQGESRLAFAWDARDRTCEHCREVSPRRRRC